MAPQENRRVVRTVFEFVGGDGHAVLDRHVKSPRGLGGDRRHVFHHLIADVIHQFIEEDMASIDLLEGDKLVRFVCLIDTARAADHRWDVGILLEQPRLRAEGNFGVIVPPGKRLRQSDDFLAGVDIEAFNGTQLFEGKAGRRIDRLHFRLKHLARMAHDFFIEFAAVMSGNAAEFKLEAAVLWNDIERGAPLNRAGVYRGVFDIVKVVERTFLLYAPRHAFEIGDQFRGILDGVHALRGQARMCLKATHVALIAHFTLMADDHLHQGWLTDDAHHRFRLNLVRKLGDQGPDSDAADLFVMTEGEVDRYLQTPFEEFRCISETDRDKALHVASAAAEELRVFFDDIERVGMPILPIDRHHVGVA